MIKRTLLHFSFIIFIYFFGTGLFGIDNFSKQISNLQTELAKTRPYMR